MSGDKDELVIGDITGLQVPETNEQGVRPRCPSRSTGEDLFVADLFAQ